MAAPLRLTSVVANPFIDLHYLFLIFDYNKGSAFKWYTIYQSGVALSKLVHIVLRLFVLVGLPEG